MNITVSSRLLRWNVAYARYQRALIVLVLFPMSMVNECAHPTAGHMLVVAATLGLGAGAGWMYREAVSWWTGGQSREVE